jgi:hypothetical protein
MVNLVTTKTKINPSEIAVEFKLNNYGKALRPKDPFMYHKMANPIFLKPPNRIKSRDNLGNNNKNKTQNSAYANQDTKLTFI